MLSIFISFWAVFIGWIVQGFIGLGSGIIATAILLFFFNAKAVVVSLSIIALLGTIYLSVANFKGNFYLKEIFLLLLFSFVGAGIGSYFLEILNHKTVEAFFGLFVVLTGIYDFISHKRNIKLPEKHKYLFAVFTGTAGGFISGLIGGAGPLYALYLNQFFHSKEDFKFVISFVFAVLNIERIVFYLWSSELRDFFYSEIIIPAVPAVFLGAFIGNFLTKSVSSTVFKELVSISIILFGFYFMYQGFLM
ncbi:MAG: sulfite exporter TauE/SafE family protein [Aquificae bacterium]|nr:sulfite exporter TauE/SafE family protein [Aquificota bacterium]